MRKGLDVRGGRTTVVITFSTEEVEGLLAAVGADVRGRESHPSCRGCLEILRAFYELLSDDGFREVCWLACSGETHHGSET